MFTICFTTLYENSLQQSQVWEEYLAQIATGNATAFEKLYKETSTAVYAFALSILKNTYDAEDVLQDCYVNIYHHASKYQPRQKPLAWILTITKNLCMQKMRVGKKSIPMTDEELQENFNHSGNVTLEDKWVLQACMKALSDQERQIIILHVLGGLKHREIAGFLEMPLSTVLSKYNRALKKLKLLLTKGEDVNE